MRTPVQYVKGIGPKLGAVFGSRGIETVKDLLFHFPRSYEDRSKFSLVKDLVDGEKSTVSVMVVSTKQIPIRSKNLNLFEVVAEDASGRIFLKWFRMYPGLEKKFKTGASFLAFGKAEFYKGVPQIVHPEIKWDQTSDASNELPSQTPEGMIPIYTELDGIPSRTFRTVLKTAVDTYAPKLKDEIPFHLLKKYGLPPISIAIQELHFPKETESKAFLQEMADFKSLAHQRLIYDEFLKFEYLVLKQRLNTEKEKGFEIKKEAFTETVVTLTKNLPFQLTDGQKSALKEIEHDFASTHPMSRLLQGDVGCGKTMVAFLSAISIIKQGRQAALMAPTEILCEQHYQNFKKYFGDSFPCFLLTGKTTTKERRAIHEALFQEATPALLIGTHALIEEDVKFQLLSFVIIDEQHRFGVEQRRLLREKGRAKLPPHLLLMSATPIPRTLALTAYGDLSVSSITELPKGRSPIQTKVMTSDQSEKVYSLIRKEILSGRQAYFIFPLVNESQAEKFQHLKSAIFEAERLANEVFPEFKIGLLHGQMKSDEKDDIMKRFSRNEIQILVSTTVVEVGVDVPNATVMCVEHAERFGLSQLHQLRGRVGRGTHASYCFLIAARKRAEITEARLDVLEETTDGFKIAEADLEIRGPGEFLGTSQSGSLPFKVANLVRDRDWLLKAREDAVSILKIDPDLETPENFPLRTYLEKEGQLQQKRLQN